MNFVTSVDGAVAVDGYSAGLSGEPDKRVFGVLRMLCDALVVAAGTLRHEGYRAVRLNERRRAWRREQGLRRVPDAGGRLRLARPRPGAGRVRRRAGRGPWCSPTPTPRRRPAWPRSPTWCAAATTGSTSRPGWPSCAAAGLGQILCEGGPHLFGALTAADLVDEVCLTVAPLLAGAGPGRITAGDPEPRTGAAAAARARRRGRRAHAPLRPGPTVAGRARCG